MIFRKEVLKIQEFYNIKLNDSVLIKIEDAARKREELLVTIAASHYGFLNGNTVVYRHDTVKNNIGTFIHPNPKPIIENHQPKKSKKFGSIIAVDYKETEYYAKLSKKHKLEDLTTEEYIDLFKNTLIPFQKQNADYDGLGYCETVGKLNDQEGIKRVLDKEFLSVSIGADPRKLVCSHCLQDQVQGICDHFHKKENGIFMLAEELEYEELSFLRNKKPADPRGKVTKIHDGKIEEIEYELEDNYLNVELDVFNIKDFFKLADETKTIVCMDNICKVINQEDTMRRKKEDKKVVSLSYVDEFGSEKIESLAVVEGEKQDGKLVDAEASKELSDKLVLADDMEDSQFAIIQKTQDEIKRRFPLHDELNVRVAVELLDSAEDLTPAEVSLAKASIEKAAKKLDIEIEFKHQDATEEETEEPEENKLEDSEKNETKKDVIVKSIEDVINELKGMVESIEETKLQDADYRNPVVAIFDMLSSVAINLKWAGEALEGRVNSFLVDQGREAVSKGHFDSLKDELQEAKDEIEFLEDLNRDLNLQVRQSLIDEIVDAKEQLGLLKDSVEEEKKKLVSHPYNVLIDQVNDFRQLKGKVDKDKVNNTKEINTIKDPTLQDASDDEGTDTTDINLTDSEREKPQLTEAQIVSLFRDLLTKK